MLYTGAKDYICHEPGVYFKMKAQNRVGKLWPVSPYVFIVFVFLEKKYY